MRLHQEIRIFGDPLMLAASILYIVSRLVPTTGPQWVCEQASTIRSRSRPWRGLECVADAVRELAVDPADIERDQDARWPAGSSRARALAQRSWTAPSDGFVRAA